MNFKHVSAHERQQNDKFSKIEILQNSVFTNDLDPPKFDVKQIFPDTGAQPQPSLHIKAQTDGMISKTIVQIFEQ